jgi:cell division protein FtsL
VPQPVQQAAEPKPAVSMPKQEQASQTQEKEEQTSEERVVRIANTAGMKEQVGFGRLLRPRM